MISFFVYNIFKSEIPVWKRAFAVFSSNSRTYRAMLVMNEQDEHYMKNKIHSISLVLKNMIERNRKT